MREDGSLPAREGLRLEMLLSFQVVMFPDQMAANVAPSNTCPRSRKTTPTTHNNVTYTQLLIRSSKKGRSLSQYQGWVRAGGGKVVDDHYGRPNERYLHFALA
jgi:hypothetical protein